jgi:hypothetical protein
MAENGTPNPPLKPAQSRALAAILGERDIRAAAKAAKIPERTLWTWLTMPAFQDGLNEAMSRVMDAAIYDLAGRAVLAVETLRDVMQDKKASAGVRVQAANIALGRLMDLREVKDSEQRLTAIERALNLRGEM